MNRYQQLARRQVIWGYAFASSSYARAVQDVIWNSSSGLEVCECVDPRVLFRWEKKLIHVRRPEIVSDKQGMGIFFLMLRYVNIRGHCILFDLIGAKVYIKKMFSCFVVNEIDRVTSP